MITSAIGGLNQQFDLAPSNRRMSPPAVASGEHAPAVGDRFTERSPNGVMGMPYNFVSKDTGGGGGGGGSGKKHRGFLRNVGRMMK